MRAALADQRSGPQEPAAAAPVERGRRAAPLLLLVWGVALLWWQLMALPAEPHSEAFHDELHYAQAARDVAAGHFPRFNRIFAPLVPPLYGVVQAPTRYFAGRAEWDWWSRALNALLLVSSLVPLYGLGRRFLRPGWAALAAGVAVVSSSLVYARYLLAESLYVPLFLWLALCVTRACERPTRARALQLGLALGLCYLTKTMVVASVPAVLVALCWSLRSARAVAKAGLALGAGTLLVVLPWNLRGLVFASEANLEAAFTYSQGLRGAGLQPLGVYFEWMWKTTGAFVIGLCFPVFLLGLAGMLTGLWSRQPARRGLAAFTLTSVLGSLALVGVATAQWSGSILKLHERYLVCFFPLFVLANFALLRAERVRPLALAAASVVALAVLFGMPAEYFDPSTSLMNPIDTPSSPFALQLVTIAGSPLALRLVYLALAAPVLLLVRKPRWAGPPLLLISAGYLGWSAWTALHAADVRNRGSEFVYRPAWDWLDGILKEGDVVIHHRLYGSTAYHNAMRYEMDYCQVDEDTLVPLHSASVKLDKRSGRYLYYDDSPPDTFFMLTDVPSEVEVPGTRSHAGMRLIPLQDGLQPLGAWLGKADVRPRVEGRAPDGWCESGVEIELASTYPCMAELGASVTLPEGFPSDTPVSVSLLRGGELLHQVTLAAGSTWAFYVADTMWSPRLGVTLEADGAALVGERRVAFHLSEPDMFFGAWGQPQEVPPEPILSGIRADLWCERTLMARFPMRSEGVRFAVVLNHPSDSPVRGPIAITVRVGERVLASIELEQGASRQLVFSATSDRSFLDLVLECDRDALLDEKRVAFRLSLAPP